MLTWEAIELGRWIYNNARASDVGDEMDFLDPLLQFKVARMTDASVTLAVGFGLEFRPPWATPDRPDAEDYQFEFECPRETLRQEAQRFLQHLTTFPKRGR